MMMMLANLPLDPWLQGVIQLGCLGIVAFGAHHVLTKTIPKMQDLFVSEIKAQRDLHNETEKGAQTAFINALNAQRVDFKEMVKEYHATNNQTAARIHDLTAAIVNFTKTRS
jgi:hypothetical protein